MRRALALPLLTLRHMRENVARATSESYAQLLAAEASATTDVAVTRLRAFVADFTSDRVADFPERVVVKSFFLFDFGLYIGILRVSGLILALIYGGRRSAR